MMDLCRSPENCTQTKIRQTHEGIAWGGGSLPLDGGRSGFRGKRPCYQRCGWNPSAFMIAAESPVARMLKSPRFTAISSAPASAVSQATAP